MNGYIQQKEFWNALENVAKTFEEGRDSLLTLANQSVTGDRGGDWDQAESLFRLAKNADSIRDRLLSLEKSSQRHLDRPATVMKSPVGSKKSSRKKKEYPKFYIEGDSLIKVGLRRSGQDEYYQSIPKAVYDNILEQIAFFAPDRNEFSASEVISLVDGPEYHIYLVLGLLRHKGLITIPRRGVHRFVNRKSFTSEAIELWEILTR